MVNQYETSENKDEDDDVDDEGDDDDTEEEAIRPASPNPTWVSREREDIANQGTVHIDTGRGQSVAFPVGAPFVDSVKEVARRANYGGYYRVFLNGGEIVNPDTAPPTLQLGMRVAVTTYDKVG